MDPLSFRRNLDRGDLVEHLDSTLHLSGLGRLVSEPVDKRAHSRDLFVLTTFLLAETFKPCLSFGQVSAVATLVGCELSKIDLDDAGGDGVEEEPVM